MTLDHLQGCWKYRLVGVVIGCAIASWGGYAFAQLVPPGLPCVRQTDPPPKWHPPEPYRRPLRRLDPETVDKLQQLAPNSRQQLQRYAPQVIQRQSDQPAIENQLR